MASCIIIKGRRLNILQKSKKKCTKCKKLAYYRVALTQPNFSKFQMNSWHDPHQFFTALITIMHSKNVKNNGLP